MEKIIELKDIDHVVAGKNFISFQSQPSITGFDSVLILNPKEVLRAEDTTGQSILSHPPALASNVEPVYWVVLPDPDRMYPVKNRATEEIEFFKAVKLGWMLESAPSRYSGTVVRTTILKRRYVVDASQQFGKKFLYSSSDHWPWTGPIPAFDKNPLHYEFRA